VRGTLDICDGAYIISEGSVIAEGTPTHVLQDSRVRAVYLGDDFVL
jgi:lipopolysaccharide export system ATP-binding protein